MRQLNPKIVEDRKKHLLQWVIHRYIKTSAPIASQAIADEADLELSSASIRNILQELESEGFLQQPHTSSGRVPTDKGYRFYVDYLTGVQRLASEEKARIDRQYTNRIEEMDRLLAETSKLLSHISGSAGLVLSPKMEKHELKRLELISLGGSQMLAVLVTQTGMVRHWPIKLSFVPTPSQLVRLNRFINDNIASKSVRELKTSVQTRVEQAERDLEQLGLLAKGILDEIDLVDEPPELYVEGANQILNRPEELGDMSEIQSIIEMIEKRNSLAQLLEHQIEESLKPDRGHKSDGGRALVRIGHENSLPELHPLSLVTATYRFRNQVVGVLGILGSKRMEYSRMMGLVDHVSAIVSRSLEHWADIEEDDV